MVSDWLITRASRLTCWALGHRWVSAGGLDVCDRVSCRGRDDAWRYSR